MRERSSASMPWIVPEAAGLGASLRHVTIGALGTSLAMLAVDAAERWRQTQESAWPRPDVEAIAALYARSATYRALAFRRPDMGIDGVRRYRPLFTMARRTISGRTRDDSGR